MGVNPLQVATLRWYEATETGTFAVGDAPVGVAFDGAHIWVANNSDNTVTKLRASDGAEVGTFPVGFGPTGVVFDGAHIWVTNFGANTVTRLRARDGTETGTFPVPSPIWAAFDGVACLDSESRWQHGDETVSQ